MDYNKVREKYGFKNFSKNKFYKVLLYFTKKRLKAFKIIHF